MNVKTNGTLDTMENVNQITLTAKDRCDASCPAGAKVKLDFDGMELLLCGHHYNKSEDTLKNRVVVDERWTLVKNIQKDSENSQTNPV